MSTPHDLAAKGAPPRLTIRAVRIDHSSLVQAARTTLAAVVSALCAGAWGLPEPVWAVITTVIVMQSSLGAAWQVSRERLVGTAIGAILGAVLLTLFPRTLLVFALGMLLMAGVCALLRQPHSAYRFAGITLAIIAMPAYADPPWVISLHRFLETGIGLVIGMVIMAAWRGADPAPAPAVDPDKLHG